MDKYGTRRREGEKSLIGGGYSQSLKLRSSWDSVKVNYEFLASLLAGVNIVFANAVLFL